MDRQKAAEIHIEDIFADTNLEIDEIDSIIKVLGYALENPKYKHTDIKEIDSTLFMLQGKLSTIKNNLRIMKESMNI